MMWGSVGEWVSGVGALTAVIAAVWLASRERGIAETHHKDEMDLLRGQLDLVKAQLEAIAREAANQVTIDVKLAWTEEPLKRLTYATGLVHNRSGTTLFHTEVRLMKAGADDIAKPLESRHVGVITPIAIDDAPDRVDPLSSLGSSEDRGSRADALERLLGFAVHEADEPFPVEVDLVYMDTGGRYWRIRHNDPATPLEPDYRSRRSTPAGAGPANGVSPG